MAANSSSSAESQAAVEGRGKGDAPIAVAPGDGERFVRDDRIVTIRVDLPELSIHEIEFDSTFEVQPHVHTHVDAMLVLEGTVELLGDGQPRRLEVGTIAVAAPGVPHGFRTPGPARAHILVMHSPDGGFAELVRNTRAGARLDWCRDSEIRQQSREWLGVCGVARFARQILVVSAAKRVASRASRRREAEANL